MVIFNSYVKLPEGNLFNLLEVLLLEGSKVAAEVSLLPLFALQP